MNTFLSLKDCRDQAVGGKAQGLAELIHYGFHVPAGFVIQNATDDYDQSGLENWYQQIGGDLCIIDRRIYLLQEKAV